MAVLAYVAAFFVGPLVGSLIELVALPLVLPLLRIPGLGLLAMATQGGVGAFAAVWVGALIFRWLGVAPTLLMAIVLGAGYVLNDLRRVAAAEGPKQAAELAAMIGTIVGIVVGANTFLYP